MNEAVLIPSTLMPVSHQKSTSLESMARADPVNTTAKDNPVMRTSTTTADLVPFRWKCMDVRPFPSTAALGSLDPDHGIRCPGHHRLHASAAIAALADPSLDPAGLPW
jgi:hypothetical protein